MGICYSDLEPEEDPESYVGLQSSSQIAQRLRHVMGCASRLLDEELLPIVDLIRVVRGEP